jgi:hypothetical protein
VVQVSIAKVLGVIPELPAFTVKTGKNCYHSNKFNCFSYSKMLKIIGLKKYIFALAGLH